MPSPPNLGEFLADVPDFKAQWLALKGTLTYAKSNFTRKLNDELALAESSKPSAANPGPELQVQLITFNTNYNLYLTKSPSWLQTFENACDTMLAFLSTAQPEDVQIVGKLQEYKEHIISEEIKYKLDFSTKTQEILTFYLNTGARYQVVPTATMGVTSGGSATSGGEIRFRSCFDLLPENLTKQATPSEFLAWLDKFK